MLRPSKLLFDANIARPMVDEIARLLQSQRPRDDEHADVIHAFQFQKSLGLPDEGVWDEVWVHLAGEQGWTIIAADRGKAGVTKGRKLPQLCVEYGITHVLLGASIHGRRYFAKLLSFLSVWHELVEIAREHPGGRFMMEQTSSQFCQSGRAKLIRRLITPPPSK